jgi:hypothetical protein
MGRIAAGAQFADGVWVAGAQAGIAADAATHACGAQAGFGALGDQRALELGDGAQHLQGEHTLRRRGVDGIAQTAKMRATRLELFDDGEQVADGAGEAIEPHDDEGFARGHGVQQLGQHRTAAIGTGGVLLAHALASGSAQLVKLRIGALRLGGDPCVADETSWGGVFAGFWRRHGDQARLRGHFYNSTRCL